MMLMFLNVILFLLPLSGPNIITDCRHFKSKIVNIEKIGIFACLQFNIKGPQLHAEGDSWSKSFQGIHVLNKDEGDWPYLL